MFSDVTMVLVGNAVVVVSSKLVVPVLAGVVVMLAVADELALKEGVSEVPPEVDKVLELLLCGFGQIGDNVLCVCIIVDFDDSSVVYFASAVYGPEDVLVSFAVESGYVVEMYVCSVDVDEGACVVVIVTDWSVADVVVI